MHTTHGVADHLKFVDDEKARSFASKKAAALSFQCGHDDASVQVDRDISGRDADVPAAGPPLGELVIGQCARRNREDCLFLQIRVEQLKDVGLPGSGRRLHDNILSLLQGANSLLLPQIRNDEINPEPLQHGLPSRNGGVDQESRQAADTAASTARCWFAPSAHGTANKTRAVEALVPSAYGPLAQRPLQRTSAA